MILFVPFKLTVVNSDKKIGQCSWILLMEKKNKLIKKFNINEIFLLTREVWVLVKFDEITFWDLLCYTLM